MELNEDGRVFCIVQDATLGLSGVDKDHIRGSSAPTDVVADESAFLDVAVESTSDKRFVCFGEDETGNTSEIVASPSFSYTPRTLEWSVALCACLCVCVCVFVSGFVAVVVWLCLFRGHTFTPVKSATADTQPPVVTIVSLVQSSRLYGTITVSCSEPATVSCSSNTVPPPSTYVAVEDDYFSSVYFAGGAQSLTQSVTVALLPDVTEYTVYCAAIDDSLHTSSVVTATLVAGSCLHAQCHVCVSRDGVMRSRISPHPARRLLASKHHHQRHPTDQRYSSNGACECDW